MDKIVLKQTSGNDVIIFEPMDKKFICLLWDDSDMPNSEGQRIPIEKQSIPELIKILEKYENK